MASGGTSLDVSVVIRTKDRPVLLTRALKSLDAQTSRNFEVIILNDGGDPEKVEITVAAHKIDEIIVVSNEESVGRAKAFNQALKIARGSFVACLDDDDTFEPDFIKNMSEELHKAIAADPITGGIICRCTEIYEDLLDAHPADYLNFGNHVKTVKTDILFEYNSAHNFVSPYFYYIGRENFLPVQTLFNRELLLQHGGFAEANDVLEDRPVYNKILFGHKVVVLNEFLANHHTRVSKNGGTNANSMHDNNNYDWGKRFAEFYIDGYYQKADVEKFMFTILRDAFRDFKWDVTSEGHRRAAFNSTRRHIYRMMKRNWMVVVFWTVLWMLMMIGFSTLGAYIVKYWF